MNKLELAHEYSKVLLTKFETITVDQIVDVSFSLAELMLAENEKRKDKSRPEALDEWQPDWSHAPDGFNYWAATCQDGKITGGWFFKGEPEIGETGNISIYHNADDCILTASFGYQGDWWNSLRKRP